MKRTLVILLLIAIIFGSGMAVRRFYDQQDMSPPPITTMPATPLRANNPQIETQQNPYVHTATKALQQQEQITASRQSAVRNAVERVAPAVVRIDITRTAPETFIDRFFDDPLFRRFFDDRFDLRDQHEREARSVGSGVIITYQGMLYILTNAHVVAEALAIEITDINGSHIAAELVGIDAMVDIALLRVTNNVGLQAAVLGDSDMIAIGDWAIAIGNPLGLGFTVTMGIISAVGRDIPKPDGQGIFHDLIQTDAAINPGNSGGPLVDAYGRVIGINVAIARQTPGGIAIEGINFAIPINAAVEILSPLIREGKVTRAWLGVFIQELTPEMMDVFGVDAGVVVADVIPSSPAAKAGLRSGDVIVAVAGEPATSVRELQQMIMFRPIGQTVLLEVVRDRATIYIEVTLEERPHEAALHRDVPAGVERNFGIIVADITPEIARQFDLQHLKGVVITEVEIGSRASRAGLQRGDVILEIDRIPINSVVEWNTVIARLDPGATPLLLLIRDGRRHFIILGK